jgi:hypothetical protein
MREEKALSLAKFEKLYIRAIRYCKEMNKRLVAMNRRC